MAKKRTMKAVETKPAEASAPRPKFITIKKLAFEEVDEQGNRIKRKLEEIMECTCADRELNCSDLRCENRQSKIDCRKCQVADCQNQRFGKGDHPKIRVFNAGRDKGRGIRAKEPIKAHEFIIEFVGEVLTQQEYARRQMEYEQEAQLHFYVYDLGSRCIDSTRRGNISRLVNHSCEPNATCLRWKVPGTPVGVDHIGFFATRDIDRGEEVTIDYQFEHTGEPQLCHCGKPTCRGVIGRSVKVEDKRRNKSAVENSRRRQRK